MSFQTALAQIKDNDPSFTSLNIGTQDGEIFPSTLADWQQLGIAVGQNDQLELLTFNWDRNDAPPDECKEAFLRGTLDNGSIGSICFHLTHIVGGESPELMASFVGRSHMECVVVKGSLRTEDEWNATLLMLKESKSIQAVGLYIDWSDIDVRERLNPILCKMPSLNELWIKGINFGMKEAEALTNLLPSLKRLDLDFANFEDNGIIALTRQLNDNRRLRTLAFCGGDLSDLGWGVVDGVLCLLNDHLEEIKGATPPALTQQLLAMNKSTDKISIRMRKNMDFDYLIQEHRNFNGEPFGNGFDRKILPEIISSIGTKRNDQDHRLDEHRLSALHYFTKNLPHFFGKSGDETDEKESHADARTENA